MDAEKSSTPLTGDSATRASGFDAATRKGLHQAMQQCAVRDILPTLAIVMLGVLVVYFSLADHIESVWFEVWAACAMSTQCLRFVVIFTSIDIEIRRERYASIIASQVLGGAVWAWLLVFWQNDLSIGLQTLFVMAPILVSLGSVTSAGAWPPFAIAVVLATKVPFFVGVAIFQPSGVMTLVLPMCVFLLLDGALLRNYHRRVRDSFEMRIRNQRLIHDLTDQNESLQLAQNEALQAADAKTDFLARMSHELRTPINGVIGGADVLSRTDLNESQRRWLNTVKRSGDDMLVLVNQLLDHTRIKHAEFDLNETAFDLAQSLKRCVAQFRIEHGSALIHLDIDPQFPRQVLGDSQCVIQAVEHLVKNALKFSDNGRVNIRLDRTVADTESGAAVRISVSDNGIGIPSDKLSAVFTDLEQVDGSMSRRFGGTGLGLTLTRQLVNLMGGRITLQTQEGIGSTFTLILPLSAVQEDVPQGNRCASVMRMDDQPQGTSVMSESSTSLDFTTLQVLVAEDNPVNQMLLESMLETLGCTVTLADDGEQALTAMMSRAFDMVFMDCQMPNMDGLQAATHARDNGLHMPIVAVTANALCGDRERCLGSGMNDYVTKPVTQDTIARMLSIYTGDNNPDSSLKVASG